MCIIPAASPPPLQTLAESASALELQRWICSLAKTSKYAQVLKKGLSRPKICGLKSLRKCSYQDSESWTAPSDAVTRPRQILSTIKCCFTVGDGDVQPGQLSNKLSHSAITDLRILSTNIGQFLKTKLPKPLYRLIFNKIWEHLSSHIRCLDYSSRNCHYTFEEWLSTATIFLTTSSLLSLQMTLLDLTLLNPEIFFHFYSFFQALISLNTFSKFVLPKPSEWPKLPDNGALLANLLVRSQINKTIQNTHLQSLTLHSVFCSDDTLSVLRQTRLQKLKIMAGFITERGVLVNLCGFPSDSAEDVLRDIESNSLELQLHSKLRDSLRSLELCYCSLPSSLYVILLVVFHKLEKFNPKESNAKSICAVANLFQSSCWYPEANNLVTPHYLPLACVNLQCPSPFQIMTISNVCPLIRKVKYISDDMSSTVDNLAKFRNLQIIHLTFEPSFFSGYSKANSSCLHSLLETMKCRLEEVCLTNFTVNMQTFDILSNMRNLQSLILKDCWIQCKQHKCSGSFANLRKLALYSTLAVSLPESLMANQRVTTLIIDTLYNDWQGSLSVDGYIRSLHASGLLNHLQNLEISSFLSLDSIQMLNRLPNLQTLGRVGRWNLPQEKKQEMFHVNLNKHIRLIM